MTYRVETYYTDGPACPHLGHILCRDNEVEAVSPQAAALVSAHRWAGRGSIPHGKPVSITVYPTRGPGAPVVVEVTPLGQLYGQFKHRVALADARLEAGLAAEAAAERWAYGLGVVA